MISRTPIDNEHSIKTFKLEIREIEKREVPEGRLLAIDRKEMKRKMLWRILVYIT